MYKVPYWIVVALLLPSVRQGQFRNHPFKSSTQLSQLSLKVPNLDVPLSQRLISHIYTVMCIYISLKYIYIYHKVYLYIQYHKIDNIIKQIYNIYHKIIQNIQIIQISFKKRKTETPLYPWESQTSAPRHTAGPFSCPQSQMPTFEDVGWWKFNSHKISPKKVCGCLIPVTRNTRNIAKG